MRFTERYDDIFVTTKDGRETHERGVRIKDKVGGFEKLANLEDIEEELGIDLITLFKAFRKGIWTIVAVINPKGEREDRIIFHEAPYKTLAENIGYFKRLFEKEYVENYGKTWALTKEELL